MSDVAQWTCDAFDLLAGRLAGAGLRGVARHAPLGALTTYRVGGTAALSVQASSEDELRRVREVVGSSTARSWQGARPGDGLPVLVVGKGSNLLVADAGFCGLALHLGGELAGIDLEPPLTCAAPPADAATTVVRAGGAAGMPVLARRAVDAGLRGLEWAAGIPGSVGGALKMNAGGHGADTASCLQRYRWFDVREPADGDDDASRLDLGYRTSSLTDSQVVVWAELRVRRGDRAEGQSEISAIVRWRREHQPGGSNAGSVFVNPPGDAAGRLVDEAGLRGFRLGTARVSEKHANFIQADDGGSADDVLDLMLHVRSTVASTRGIELRAEVKLVGFPPARVAALRGIGSAPTEGIGA